MENADMIFFIVLPSLVTIIPIIIGVVYLFRYRDVKNIPTTSIRDIEQGKMEVKGTAHPIPGREQISPIKREPCVRYDTIVAEEERDQSGALSSMDERALWYEVMGNEFLVRDSTGTIRVDAELSEMVMKQVISHRERALDTPSTEIEDFKRRVGLRGVGVLDNIRGDVINYRESILPEGQPLYILGIVEEAPIEEELRAISNISPYRFKRSGSTIISMSGEKEVEKRYRNRGIGLIAFGIGMFLLLLVFYVVSLFI